MEAYIKRLQDLEEIANSFEGIKQSYAIQAGREIRIIVHPNKVTDDQITILAHDVREKIENNLDYPEISKSQLSVKQEQQMLLSKCRRVRRALFYWLKVRLGLGPKFQVEVSHQKKFTWRLVVQAFLG